MVHSAHFALKTTNMKGEQHISVTNSERNSMDLQINRQILGYSL